jgi:hypothetical protein
MNIIDQLPSNNDDQILWKFDDVQLYEKYTQYVKQNKNKNNTTHCITTPLVSRSTSHPTSSPTPKKAQNEISTTASVTELSKFFPTHQDDKQSNQQQEKAEKQEKQHSAKPESCKTEATKRVKRQSPTTVILQLSENNEINSGYMQQKIIEFISKKEFIKFFGVKKSSEVMSALSANKWNKSLVLFISFLFDVSFIYLNKEVQYDSEKKYEDVITI